MENKKYEKRMDNSEDFSDWNAKNNTKCPTHGFIILCTSMCNYRISNLAYQLLNNSDWKNKHQFRSSLN